MNIDFVNGRARGRIAPTNKAHVVKARKALVPFLLLAPLAFAGCQKVTPEAPEGAADRNVAITITDDGCTVSPESIGAGALTFKVKNSDAKAVTEAELINSDGRILAEKENLTPGLGGTFALNLDAGKYSVYCPGAKNETVALAVTGKAAKVKVPAEIGAHLKQGTVAYADFVKSQTKDLVTATKAFTDAVRAGDVEKAKELYGPARVFWERIEPVAESFGDLDPAVDARVNDVEDKAKWTGFHPIEEALWVKKSTAGMEPLADKLDADVQKLDKLVQTQEYQPADLANGATTLLTEVSGSKITGEEEFYSHLDLLDMWANVDGAKRAFDLLTPALNRIDPKLVTKVNARFTDVNQTLAKYRDGASFKSYDTLSKAQVKEISDKVDALAEPLADVAPKVAQFK